jgi:hypothetical protein
MPSGPVIKFPGAEYIDGTEYIDSPMTPPFWTVLLKMPRKWFVKAQAPRVAGRAALATRRATCRLRNPPRSLLVDCAIDMLRQAPAAGSNAGSRSCCAREMSGC